MDISVIIPVYNESGNIRTAVEKALQACRAVGEAQAVEIIVVDDHSSDGTFEVVKKIGDARVKCIRLSRRCGSHTALRAGLKYARGEAALCISADGQDDPACLAQMLEKRRNGAKVIWALRRDRGNEPWYIRSPAQLFYRILFWLGGAQDCGIDTEQTQRFSAGCRRIDFSRADFFLLDRAVINAVNACPERNTSLFGLIAWLGFSRDFVEYDRRRRESGRSKWNFRSRLHLAKDWVIAFSGAPLKIMSILGVVTAVLGFLYGIFVVIFALTGSPVKGWSSIIVAVFVLSGIQMIMLGTIGEYLWRNLDESRKRPLYFIEDSA